MINQEHEEAKRVVVEYKKLDQNSIYKSVYDPFTRCHTMQRIFRDPNTSKFKIKTDRKRKAENIKVVKQKLKKVVLKKEPKKSVIKVIKPKVTKLNYNNRVATQKKFLDDKMLNMILDRKTYDEMSIEFNTDKRNLINRFIKNIKPNHPNLKVAQMQMTDTYAPYSDKPIKILPLLKKGLTGIEISKELGIDKQCVDYYRRILKSQYPEMKIGMNNNRGLTAQMKDNLKLMEEGFTFQEISLKRKKSQCTIRNAFYFLQSLKGIEWADEIRKLQKIRKKQLYDDMYEQPIGINLKT